jgi:type IV secretory pathway TraG/TraD family ATPase VirD4
MLFDNTLEKGTNMKKQFRNRYDEQDAKSKHSTSQILGWDTGESEALGFQLPRKRTPVLYAGEGHQITFGITGSGKNVSAAAPQLLSWQNNLLALDTKGELRAVTSRWREQVLGHRIVTFDPFNATDLKSPDGINPHDLADFMNVSNYEAANVIASLVMGTAQKSALTRGSSNDEFWQDQATQLLVGVIGAALEGKLTQKNASGKDPFPAIQSPPRAQPSS